MMSVGQRAETRRTFSKADLTGFSALAAAPAGDAVPEPLIAGMVSYLLGVHLPGPGTNYLKQDLNFHAPAPLGQELVATVEITRLRTDKHLVDLWAECRTADGQLICDGRSLVKAKDVGA